MTETTLRKTNGEIAASIVSLVYSLGSGDRAKLRRGEYSSGFWRVWNGAGLEGTGGALAPRWERFIRAVAIFAGTSTKPDFTEKRLGASMAGAGIKETRFERLIIAPIDVRPDLLDRLVRQICRKTTTINFYDLCDLYLWEEPLRLRAISASYYSNLQNNEAE